MNIEKLKLVEQEFLAKFPESFNSPEMIEIGKKHKMNKMVEFAQEHFSPDKFDKPEVIVQDMIAMVTKSSMVSLFEKPKYRDYVKTMAFEQKEFLVSSLYEFLHGNQEKGFSMMVEILDQVKLAKWTLITVFGVYYYPTKEIFVKPTTTKNIIAYLELNDLVYKPRPTYDFYKKYRAYINKMKKQVDKSLSPNNAAFTGFLMFSM
ncbi:MAG: hypothetical protein DRP93_02330 [Candidatus Neomarinimicrobiota bacterium]|nr:MAG: hypothetical protein DRP93_02330 [Candidatus Neomarinimicrobiota bacterium]